MEEAKQILVLIAGLSQVITMLTLLIGGVKLYYILGEYSPHRHSETRQEHLKASGIMYPKANRVRE